jgi:hypothetical protein
MSNIIDFKNILFFFHIEIMIKQIYQEIKILHRNFNY